LIVLLSANTGIPDVISLFIPVVLEIAAESFL